MTLTASGEAVICGARRGDDGGIMASGWQLHRGGDGRGGCQQRARRVVTVNPLPMATINASGATTLCEGGSVTLTASGAASYSWSPGGDKRRSWSMRLGPTAWWGRTRRVRGRARPTVVTVNPLPVATITPSGATAFCQGGSVTLTAERGGELSVEPRRGDNGERSTVDATGSYTVMGTDAMGAQTSATEV